VTDPFAPPPEPSGIKPADLLGKLLLIRPISYEPGVQTVHGATDAIRCRIAELDGSTPGTVHNDVMLFGRNLVGQLRAALDGGVEMVLGRMGQGEAKPGQSPPWRLLNPTEQDRATARAYLASRPSTGTAAPPTPTPQPPAPSPFQAPAPSRDDEAPF
jgi:hypothetical protein